jgi:hypothetical protein
MREGGGREEGEGRRREEEEGGGGAENRDGYEGAACSVEEEAGVVGVLAASVGVVDGVVGPFAVPASSH